MGLDRQGQRCRVRRQRCGEELSIRNIALTDSNALYGAVEFVSRCQDAGMYHELLHRELGVPLVNGRRQIHNAAFRAAERRFKQYEQAELALKLLAR